SWWAALERRGVRIVERCAVEGWAKRDGRALAVRTVQGEISADAFVVATGAWTPTLNRQLGVRVPIQPGKGYSVTMPRPARCAGLPMLFEEDRVAVTPMETGYRLGWMMEFVGYDATIDRARVRVLFDAAAKYLHEPSAEPVVEEWFGWRPMTPDGLPIIDRSPRMDNVLIAAGHNMLGLSMAPATGRLAAELLAGRPPHTNPTAYSIRRF